MNLFTILPESFLRWLSPSDRKQLAGDQPSASKGHSMNLQSRFPHASKTFIALNDSLQPSVSQPAAQDALGKKNQGTKESRGRVALRYRIYRVRPQDIDNAYGSTKALTDALVLSGLIQNDDPTKITTQIEQEKVAHFGAERIELTIKYP